MNDMHVGVVTTENLDALVEALKDAVLALRAATLPPIQVHPAAVTMPPPIIEVTAPVTATVESTPPDVTVEAPVVNVSPQVIAAFRPSRVTKTIHRDGNGYITQITEEWT